MGQELNHYQFINSQTGNVIGYLSLPAFMDENQRKVQLESKKATLAIIHSMNLSLIYWQDKDHPII
ncbi:hypothetical protein [Mucilaginibacter sp.]|jgi:hypothetical protein|uniref:hypothetical protein n=1 Tax=Mucilaginibacter sp. TaxID=1882438 RepID=UPI0035660D98